MKIIAVPLEIMETIEKTILDCENLQKEGNLTEFGDGQLQLANTLVKIVHEWKRKNR